MSLQREGLPRSAVRTFSGVCRVSEEKGYLGLQLGVFLSSKRVWREGLPRSAVSTFSWGNRENKKRGVTKACSQCIHEVFKGLNKRFTYVCSLYILWGCRRKEEKGYLGRCIFMSLQRVWREGVPSSAAYTFSWGCRGKKEQGYLGQCIFMWFAEGLMRRVV